MMRTLQQENLVVLGGLQDLRRGDIVLFSSVFKTIDIAAVLALDVGALLSQSMTFLLSSLFGRETFLVGGNETVVLLIEPCLTLLETFTLLYGSRDIRLHALDLSLDVGLDCVELASHGVLVVTLLFPLCFLSCSLSSILFRNGS